MSLDIVWCGPASDAELRAAETALGHELPKVIRELYARARRFASGDNGRAWVEIYPPVEAVEMTKTVTEFPDRERMFVFGGDGSREMLCIDESVPEPPVYSVEITGSWETAIQQASSVGELMDRLASGTFAFVLEEG